MLRHDAQAALLGRLRTRCGSSRAYTALGLITELLRIAHWRTGEVLGSDVALAAQLGINRKTWMGTAADLAATGVLVEHTQCLVVDVSAVSFHSAGLRPLLTAAATLRSGCRWT